MRLIHTSDLHLGISIRGFSMHDEQEHMLGQILDALADHAADALLIPGDLYDKAQPSTESMAQLDSFLARLGARGTPAFISCGNHDSAVRLGYASRLLKAQQLFISPPYDGQIVHHTLHDDFGPVTFWLIPFVKPALVRHVMPDASIESYTDALGALIGSLPIDTSQRNVALAHQFVVGPRALHDPADLARQAADAFDSSELQISVGGTDNVNAGVFAPFDYVALGHIHRAYNVMDGTPLVRYSGSPMKLSAEKKEATNTKTLSLVELGPKTEGRTQIELKTLELEPLHDLRHITGRLDELTSPEVVASAPADDYLHVVLTDEVRPADALARLRAVYPRVMSFEMAYERQRAGTGSYGASGVAGASGLTGADGAALDMALCDIRQLDPFELFESFYQDALGHPLDEVQAQAATQALEAAQACPEDAS